MWPDPWHCTGTARLSAPCTAAVYSAVWGTRKILASAYSKVSVNFVLGYKKQITEGGKNKRVKRLLYIGNLNGNKTKLSWNDVTNDGNCPRITKLVKNTIKLNFSAFYNVKAGFQSDASNATHATQGTCVKFDATHASHATQATQGPKSANASN